jgi:hypothetical protein
MSDELSENECPKCGKECKDLRGRKIHEARCTGVIELHCEGCKEVFKNIYNLQRHKPTCTSLLRIKDQEEHEEKIKHIVQNYEEKLKDLTSNIESIVLTKINEERNKLLAKHQSELDVKDAQTAKLTQDIALFRQLIYKVGILSSADDENEMREYIASNDTNTVEYVYIIQEREFIKENRPLYKIGRTEQAQHKRSINYPKGSRVLIVMSVSNCKLAEAILKKKFAAKFKQDRTIGIEYFEGDLKEMKREFINVLLNLD